MALHAEVPAPQCAVLTLEIFLQFTEAKACPEHLNLCVIAAYTETREPFSNRN